MTSNKILFNHYYKLHHDIKRTYVLGRESGDDYQKDFVNAQWVSKIHPLFAMIFSLLSKPVTRHDAIKEISYFLNITDEESSNFLLKFLSSEEPFLIKYKGFESIFPKNIIVDEVDAYPHVQIYSPEEFIYKDVDLKQERFYKAPLGIIFMVNNTCATNCVYCYADKRVKRETIPFEKVVHLIEEAKSLNVNNFSVTGGEFFLYKQWDNLLDTLIRYDYKPDLISTKIPIDEKTILTYKKYGLPLQVSLDTLNENKLINILGVNKKYSENIQKTILLLEKHGIKFQVSTVLTHYNDDIEGLVQMYNFLNRFKKLSRWEIRVGFKSLYSKSNFDTIKIGKDEVDKIEKWINQIKKNSTINILWSPNNDKKYFNSEGGSKNFKGSRCSANYSHMVILPDGQVTICEQLYWNPEFIIGNILENSIRKIWNSPKALALAFPKKENFSDKSICKSCDIFEECMAFPNRCITDILKGYGDENGDFPDPRCSKAPAFINNLT